MQTHEWSCLTTVAFVWRDRKAFHVTATAAFFKDANIKMKLKVSLYGSTSQFPFLSPNEERSSSI